MILVITGTNVLPLSLLEPVMNPLGVSLQILREQTENGPPCSGQKEEEEDMGPNIPEQMNIFSFY